MRVSLGGFESAEKSKVANRDDEMEVEIGFPVAAIADLRPRKRFEATFPVTPDIANFCLCFSITSVFLLGSVLCLLNNDDWGSPHK